MQTESQQQHTQNSFSQVIITTNNSKKSKNSKISKATKNSKASKFSKTNMKVVNKLQNIETPLHKSNEVENPELEQINIKKVEVDNIEEDKDYKIKTQSLKSILEKLEDLENKPPSYNEVVQCFHEGKFFQLTEN